MADRQRPLKKRGRTDAKLIGRYLKAQGAGIECIYSSPATRASQTAEIIAKQYGRQLVGPELTEPLYTFDWQQLLDWLQTLDNRWQRAAVVGHNPAVTDLVNLLAATAIDNIPTCGLAELQCSLDDWSQLAPGLANLIRFTRPGELRPPEAPQE